MANPNFLDQNSPTVVHRSKNGNVYTGQISDRKKNGNGNLIYSNGNQYTGSFNNGSKSGKGKFSWVNGDTYIGQFLNNKPNGSGIFTFGATGQKYIGEFK